MTAHASQPGLLGRIIAGSFGLAFAQLCSAASLTISGSVPVEVTSSTAASSGLTSVGSSRYHLANISTSTPTISSSSSTLTETVQLSLVPVSSSSTSSQSNATANGSQNGFVAASACNIASLSYSSLYQYQTVLANMTTLTASTSETIIYPTNVPTFTLCDGFPRANATPITSLVTYTTTALASPVTLWSDNRPPPPSCQIGSSDCTALWSSYVGIMTGQGDNNTGIDAMTTPACPAPSNTPSCLIHTSVFTWPDHPLCTFNAGPVRLIYFTVSVQGSGLCGNNYTTITNSNLSMVSTVQTLGTTFTSGTAYVSFEGLSAADRCGNPVGMPMSNFFMPVQSSDVSTLCGEYGLIDRGPTPTAVNYAYLQKPIPLSVYSCQAKCQLGFYEDATSLCPTIFDDYAPALAYPTAVTGLQSAWKSCWFDSNLIYEDILYDPPVPLTPAAAAATPTLPATSSVTTPASTGQTVSRGPQNTSPASASLNSGSSTPSAAPTQSSVQDPGAASDTQATSTPKHASSTSGNDPAPDSQEGASTSATGANNAASASAQVTSSSLIKSQAYPTSPVTTLQLPSTGGAVGVLLSALSSTSAVGSTGGGDVASAIASGIRLSQPQFTYSPATSAGAGPTDPASTVQGPGTSPTSRTTVTQGVSIASDPSDALAIATLAGSSVIYAAPSGTGVVVGSATIAVGQATTVGSAVVSVATGGSLVISPQSGSSATTLAIGGQQATNPGTALQAASGAAMTLTAASQTLLVSQQGSAIIVAGSTLNPGQATIISGLTLSAQSSGQGIVIGSKTLTLPAISTAPAATTLMAGSTLSAYGATIVAPSSFGKSSVVIVNGKTLSLGGSAATVNGEVFTVGSSGMVVSGSSGTTTLALQNAVTSTSGAISSQTPGDSRGGNSITQSATSVSSTKGAASTSSKSSGTASDGYKGAGFAMRFFLCIAFCFM